MTKSITEELARLNALKARTVPDGVMDAQALGHNLFMYREASDDALALLNTMHGLLVQAREALGEAVSSHDNLYMAHFNDAHGCEHDLAIIPARLAIAALDAALGRV